MNIAIVSGKGGTGKTTLAVNLALYLAERAKTALVDLDVEEPNGALFIKGNLMQEQQAFRMVPTWDKSSCILCGKCKEVCNFNAVLKLGSNILVLPELCHSCYACSELCPSRALPMNPIPLGKLSLFHSEALSFLEGKLDIGAEQATPLINQCLDYALEHFRAYTYQIWDSPPGTSCPVIAATKRADQVILVTEPTPFGLHDLSLAVEALRHLNKPMAVVVNRYGIGNDDVFSYCQANNIPVWATIPHLKSIAELYSDGKPVYLLVPEVAAALQQITEHLEASQ